MTDMLLLSVSASVIQLQRILLNMGLQVVVLTLKNQFYLKLAKFVKRNLDNLNLGKNLH